MQSGATDEREGRSVPFSNAPWSGAAVQAALDASDFCAVCLIDLNESGAEKVKGNCKLPVKATPDGPYNVNAIHACAGAHGVMAVDAPTEDKRKAARKIVSLYREMKEEPPEGVMRMAGMR